MIVLDTLKLADLLNAKAAFTDAQAAAFVATFSEIIAMSYGNLATKEDIKAMVADANAKFAEADAKLADTSAKLTTEISNVRDTLSRWMFGLIITLVITLVTLLTKLR
jgi:hypothetical protein